MGDFRPASLFVSYSHNDSRLVGPLVEMNEDLQQAAWVDYLHTPPGVDWGAFHQDAISGSYRLILLWSKNAAVSRNVEREWRWALQCGTPIVPVLLDATPLPIEIGNIHAVSLQEYVFDKRRSLSIGRFPPTEWMGLGTAYDTIAVIIGAFIILAGMAFSIMGIASSSILIKIVGWIGAVLFSLFVYGLLIQVPIAISRYKLRHRLTRIVIQSLKEWGNENRAQ